MIVNPAPCRDARPVRPPATVNTTGHYAPRKSGRTGRASLQGVMRLVCCLAMLLAAVGARADEHRIYLHIYDVESGERMTGSRVSLVKTRTGELLGQSTDNDTEMQRPCQLVYYANPTDTFAMRLKVECQGYNTKTYDLFYSKDFPNPYDVDNRKTWLVPTGCTDDVDRLIKLHELTVVATKVKMVMRGDTIVYDASAFKLAEGSMLDALVEQLPGARLSNDGRITVNGQFVSSLLVDGKEFFSGDPNVALRNLPSYTVKSVNVYRRDTELERFGLSDRQQWELPLVMDVRLKPQYHKGMIANAEGGYGTDNHYVGRAFFMEYARRGRVAAYGSINNINNETAFQGGGTWGDDRATTGERRTAKAGLDFSWDNKWAVGWSESDFEMSIRGNAVYTNSDVRNESASSTTEFLPSGNNYLRRTARSRDRSDRVNAEAYWTADIPTRGRLKMLAVQGRPRFAFSNGNTRATERGARFLTEPTENKRGAAVDSVFGPNSEQYGRKAGVVYRNSYDASGHYRRVHAGDREMQLRFIPQSRSKAQYCIYLSWNYDHADATGRSTRRVDYADADAENLFRKITDTEPSTQWDAGATMRQIYAPSLLRQFIFYEGFSHSYSNGRRDVYELSSPLATLQDAVRDLTNSYYSRERCDYGFVRARYSDDISLSPSTDFVPKVNIEAGLRHKFLHYRRDEINARRSKNWWDISPDVNLSIVHRMKDGKIKLRYWIAGSMTTDLPPMTDLIDYTDNMDPLTVFKGNPSLKAGHTVSASAGFSHENRVYNRLLELSAQYVRYIDRRTQSMAYDPATGVSTYMPVNVDGAYTVGGNVNITSPLGRSGKWYLSSNTGAAYDRIPDWIAGGNSAAELSRINNTRLSESLEISWRASDCCDFSLRVDGTWRNIRSANRWFTPINAADISAKVGAQLSLPWELQCKTEFNITSRIGYSDPAFNTTDCIWNISLQRAFYHGRITVRAEAFDILGQISDVAYAVNAFGQTETWTNSLRRYAMLTLSYRFSLMPKKP